MCLYVCVCVRVYAYFFVFYLFVYLFMLLFLYLFTSCIYLLNLAICESFMNVFIHAFIYLRKKVHVIHISKKGLVTTMRIHAKSFLQPSVKKSNNWFPLPFLICTLFVWKPTFWKAPAIQQQRCFACIMCRSSLESRSKSNNGYGALELHSCNGHGWTRVCKNSLQDKQPTAMDTKDTHL